MRRTKAEAAETRAAILAAAEHIFFEKGVANTSLDEIATAAGVTRGAIYWHFASKTDLFLELYNSVRLPLAAQMVDLENSDCDERDALAVIEKACCDWLELLAQDEQRQRMLTIMLRTNFTDEFHPVMEAMASLDESHRRNIENILGKAHHNKRLAANWTPSSSGRALKWMIKGICWEWLLSGHKFDLVKDGGDSIRRLFASFRHV